MRALAGRDAPPDDEGGYQDEVPPTSELQAASATLEFYRLGDVDAGRDLSENRDLSIWPVAEDWGGDDDVYLFAADQDWTVSGDSAIAPAFAPRIVIPPGRGGALAKGSVDHTHAFHQPEPERHTIRVGFW